MLCAAVIPGILALLRVWGDMVAMADNMQIGLPFSVTVLKFIIMWFHKKELEPVINMIVEDWLRTKTVQERDTMVKQARIARIMVIPMLVQTYYLRDITETPLYEIVISVQAISILMAAISYTGIDTFLCLLVFHICAQMEILKERFLSLNNFKDFDIGLSFNIKDHLRLIRSVDIIDNTFNLMLLTLLVFFAMLFCLQGFLIVNIIDGGGEGVSVMRICWLVSILINTFAHMCLYCVVGEILIAKGEGIFYAVYNYMWYLRTPNEVKNLMLIMIRAERPLYITAGRIFPMTLSMFCSVRCL
ncbi:OR4 protein, partial [Acromyrmex charruanus]